MLAQASTCATRRFYTAPMDLVLAAAAGLAVLWVPGALLARAFSIESRDRLLLLSQQCALGLAFWPVLFLITSSLRLSWNAGGARVLLLVLGAMLIASRPWRNVKFERPDLLQVGSVTLLTIVVFTRFRQIRHIALPIWVDSVHHTMIVRLLSEHGRLPGSYAPFIPESTFYYHWGFHAFSAFVAWISGMTSPADVPRLLLGIGQLLNVLVFLAVYCAGIALFRNRRTALLASTLATLVSLFPAYYVSWGRYTQLCGLVLLPPLAHGFWRLGRHPSSRRAGEVAVLSAGLLLIHVRVAVVFAILASVLVLVLVMQRRWKGLASCAAAAFVAVLVAAPWLVHLARTPQVRVVLVPAAAQRAQWETSNAVPDDLLWAPHNDFLFATATGGLLGLTPVRLTLPIRIAAIVWWLLLVILLLRAKTRMRDRVDPHDAWRLGIVVAWVVLTALLINLDRMGLPRLRIVPNGAAIILLFLPVSLVAAHLLRWAVDASVSRAQRNAVTVIATILVGVAGAAAMLDIVNPSTVLATAADRRALDWIRENTPASSNFAVGVQPWIGGSFIGIDGGYWIPLIAERKANLPPGLYRWVMPAVRVDSITRDLRVWYEASQAGDVTFLSELRAQHVTHLYFGPRNTTALRSAIAASPRVSRVYARDGVEIYELR